MYVGKLFIVDKNKQIKLNKYKKTQIARYFSLFISGKTNTAHFVYKEHK